MNMEIVLKTKRSIMYSVNSLKSFLKNHLKSVYPLSGRIQFPLIKKSIYTLIVIVLTIFLPFVNELFNLKKNLVDVFAYDSIGDKLKQTSPGITVETLAKIWGIELLRSHIDEKYSEYIFFYNRVFVQAIVDRASNTSILVAFMSCSEEIPIKRKSLSSLKVAPITLNKSTFEEVATQKIPIIDWVVDYVSEVTYNSFHYEYGYLANPGGYQTVYFGLNDSCNTKNATIDFNEETDSHVFSRKSKINVYAESAPLEGDTVSSLLKTRKVYLGPDRIKLRILNLDYQ